MHHGLLTSRHESQYKAVVAVLVLQETLGQSGHNYMQLPLAPARTEGQVSRSGGTLQNHVEHNSSVIVTFHLETFAEAKFSIRSVFGEDVKAQIFMSRPKAGNELWNPMRGLG